jgi:anthranilate synthase/aminodeoxychorismate synthase-like glutamine amidotransferase
MLLLIDNYDSFTYNLAQYLGELGEQVRVERNDAIGIAAIDRMEPEHIVISPGPCTPNEAGISMDVISHFAGRIPILGVCLGHQAIGQVFGGRIVRAGRVMHGKLSKVFHDERGLFAGVANPFSATRYHSLVIEPDSLPEVLEVTAKTWQDEIMGVRHRGLAGTAAPIEGVQFHPESIMTGEGMRILANFVAMGRQQASGFGSRVSSPGSAPEASDWEAD